MLAHGRHLPWRVRSWTWRVLSRDRNGRAMLTRRARERGHRPRRLVAGRLLSMRSGHLGVGARARSACAAVIVEAPAPREAEGCACRPSAILHVRADAGSIVVPRSRHLHIPAAYARAKKRRWRRELVRLQLALKAARQHDVGSAETVPRPWVGLTVGDPKGKGRRRHPRLRWRIVHWSRRGPSHCRITVASLRRDERAAAR